MEHTWSPWCSCEDYESDVTKQRDGATSADLLDARLLTRRGCEPSATSDFSCAGLVDDLAMVQFATVSGL